MAALKKAKPGTREPRAALQEAIKTQGRTLFAHGVLNWTATDHWRYPMETGVMWVVKNGDRALADRLQGVLAGLRPDPRVCPGCFAPDEGSGISYDLPTGRSSYFCAMT